MASNKGYTTATKVRAVMAEKVLGVWSDTEIEDCINRAEGIVDNRLDSTITIDTTKPNHMVVEGAVTWLAALQVAATCAPSWNTLAELVNFQNVASYMVKLYLDAIETDITGDRILGA